MQIGEAEIDFNKNQIVGPTGVLYIEPMVMQVLKVLVENAGQVVSRNNLIDEVWGVGAGGDERLSRAISILRKSFGDSPNQHQYIQTIPRRGYLLTSDIVGSDPLVAAGHDQEYGATSQIDQQTRKLSIAGLLIGVLLLIPIFYTAKEFVFTSTPPPLVIIMDSAHPARIYDEETIFNGGTNADILSDILADLPIRTQKELISPNWHRHEALTQFKPDLILIHYSGFNQEDASGDRPQLKLLIEYFSETKTQFLVYSRASEAWLRDKMDILEKSLDIDHSELPGRIHIFPLLEHGEPHWKDIASSQAVKLRLKEVLDLD